MLLKEMRQKNQYTQASIAKLLGIAKNTYYQYENGIRNVPIQVIERLADIYGCTVDELLGRGETRQLFEDARIPQSELDEVARQLSAIQQSQLLSYARGMLDANKSSKK